MDSTCWGSSVCFCNGLYWMVLHQSWVIDKLQGFNLSSQFSLYELRNCEFNEYPNGQFSVSGWKVHAYHVPVLNSRPAPARGIPCCPFWSHSRLSSLLFFPCSAGQRTSVLPLVFYTWDSLIHSLGHFKSQQTKLPQNNHWIFLTTKANFQGRKRKKTKSCCFLSESAIASVSHSNTHECQQNQQSCSLETEKII